MRRGPSHHRCEAPAARRAPNTTQLALAPRLSRPSADSCLRGRKRANARQAQDQEPRTARAPLTCPVSSRARPAATRLHPRSPRARLSTDTARHRSHRIALNGKGQRITPTLPVRAVDLRPMALPSLRSPLCSAPAFSPVLDLKLSIDTRSSGAELRDVCDSPLDLARGERRSAVIRLRPTPSSPVCLRFGALRPWRLDRDSCTRWWVCVPRPAEPRRATVAGTGADR
jgi:hypothetical protein